MKLMLALAIGLLPASPPPKTLTFKDVVIAKTLPAVVGCGIHKSWGAVDFTQDGMANRAYVLCADADKLPVVGARCTLTVTVTAIDGATPDNRNSPYGGYAVDEMTCDPPIKG